MTLVRNINQVNKAIQEKYPKVFLCKGEGYFYLASDDNEMGLFLAGLYSTSIDVFRINHLSLERWMESVDSIMNSKD